MPKRQRAPTSPLEVANRKTDKEFIADYLPPDNPPPDTQPWTTTWTHPKTGTEYTVDLVRIESLSERDFMACFQLIEQTSRVDYENSTAGWNARKKMIEMKSPGLRYILVKEKDTAALGGFTSLMPTYEEGQPVIYCYEIHLQPSLQGTGLGSLLMGFHTTIAANLPPITKVMLTCFLANQRGLNFYTRLGFETDDISPVPRTLRYGKLFTPDYLILSKPVRSRFEEGGSTELRSETP
ncbi:uncharacterized protein B0H64DRAFT_242156 [Chaetomium fimeti]|uniref:N-alpha-acetyltransferase 40 n=1 Tax=Chaetomium fimeti TaxID=1854472 RepID=A0AAE0HAA8_9PEZI|nr:hypothetical protein B0H64DRAFT_242156 [Chaetomium fimeti]